MKARKALRKKNAPRRPRIDGGPKRKTFAAENRERTARKKKKPRPSTAHVVVQDGPLPRRKPGKITAGGALTARFELNAQELRDLRAIAVHHGFATPAAWTLNQERKAAQFALPFLVAEAIEGRRPKVADLPAETGAP
jgi:hypothetical protein